MKKRSFVKKLVAIIAIFLVVIIVLVIVGFSLYGNQAIKYGIEKGGTYATKVPVTVGDVDLSVFGGSIALSEMSIANPPGYQHEQLMTFDTGHVAVNMGSLTSDTIVIDEILFDGLTITIEQKGLTSNIKDLIKGMEKEQAPEADTPEPQEDAEKPKKNLKIAHLKLINAQANIKLIPIPGKVDTLKLKLSPIEMHDIGADDKVNVGQLIGKVLTAVLGGIVEQGAGIIPGDLLNGLGDQLKNLQDISGVVLKGGLEAGGKVIEGGGKVLEGAGQAGKNVLEGAGKTGKGVLEGAGKTGEGVIKETENIGKGIAEGLGGLLNKKDKEKSDGEANP